MGWRFGVAYAILGILAACAVAGVVLGVTATTQKASKTSVRRIEAKLDPSVREAIDSACAFVAKDANTQGVVISDCKLMKPDGGQVNPEVDGDNVKIALVVKDLKGEFYLVGVVMNKGIYQVSGQIKVFPAGRKSPPSKPY